MRSEEAHEAPPAYLSERARQEWATLLPVLRRECRWSPRQRALLGAYCAAVERLEALTVRLSADGLIVRQQPDEPASAHPLLESERAQLALVSRLGAQLGLDAAT